eukprot:1819416-Ditylum_brightwellii.AAC.1
MIFEEQSGLLDLEFTVQPQCNPLFPVAVTLDDQGHGSLGTSSHIGLAEGIYTTSENACHLNSNHNTTSMSYSEGSSNRNVHSENISTLDIDSPQESHHILPENKPQLIALRDHPPPIQ